MPTVALAALFFAASSLSQDGLSKWEAQSGYVSLFNGQNLDGWKGWKRDTIPGAWRAVEGEMRVVPGDDDGDLCTVRQFGDFDLRVEFKNSKNTNSGIIYRAQEDYPEAWKTGPEYQVFDDFSAYGNKPSKTSSGSIFDVYAPSAGVCRPPGQWNEARIVAKGNHIEHWLNGVKVIDIEIGSAEFQEKLGRSKFARTAGFATKARGYLVLQDHGHEVAFRRLRLKEL